MAEPVIRYPRRVIAGEDITVQFAVLNKTRSSCRLSRIETSCGCAKAAIKVGSEFVKSGEIKVGETVGRVLVTTEGRGPGSSTFDFVLWFASEDASEEIPLLGKIIVEVSQGITLAPNQLNADVDEQYVGVYGDIDGISLDNVTTSDGSVTVKDVTEIMSGSKEFPESVQTTSQFLTLRKVLAIAVDPEAITAWHWVDVAGSTENHSKKYRVNLMPKQSDSDVKLSPSSLVFVGDFSKDLVQRKVRISGIPRDEIEVRFPEQYGQYNLFQTEAGTEMEITFSRESEGKTFEVFIKNKGELLSRLPVTVMSSEAK